MNLLLDTHILIWTLNGDRNLSETAREMILNPDNNVFYSSVSVWEIAIKHSLHPDNVKFSGREFMRYCIEAGFSALPLKDIHVLALESLTRQSNAPDHKDPFDRMLIAQAKSEKMKFLTHDGLLPYYNEQCILIV